MYILCVHGSCALFETDVKFQRSITVCRMGCFFVLAFLRKEREFHVDETGSFYSKMIEVVYGEIASGSRIGGI